MTELEKMRLGHAFNTLDLELRQLRESARLACAKFNAHPSKGNMKHITRLFASFDSVILEPGFQCDYGVNISLGKNVYVNFQCVFLDAAPIIIGNNVLIGPGTHLYTVDHPKEAELRRTGACSAKPIEIGDDVWVGGGVKILPGVKIGKGAIIGANAVVTKDISEGAVYY
ncbi:maltose acetyltransferase [Marinomonas sp. SBI22]|uniref:sugar O-acetyltransferase n=1 Tax=unclassified Marinomonas TaxID=196814 RepID=UPI0007AF4449|nr:MULTISPECIES: sugar O-acetyltransferase [unclassified Marinomonas]KZM45147.1 maltose acetyltransferase [Marinomonas sp. SBI22]KZM46845.1 maltose acetyltransferase [Marinomonas sp. SBI8L]